MIELNPAQVKLFEEQGFLVIENMLTPEEIKYYRDVYERFLNNEVDAGKFRSDLGGFVDDGTAPVRERITQIMLPSRILPEIADQPMHHKALKLSQQLLGDDMALDFDMLIDKAPFTNTPTPWHQDCSYWIAMPDKRAASCWVALDDCDADNGCMWYVPGSHLLPVREHRPAGKGGGALECDASESEGVAVPLKAGSCVWHHGGTLHYSRGNSTDRRRRAFITNFRPASMVAYEREKGFDHTGEREVRS
ncbi:MAG: phytanoyl-CoA dioxygenase family protein [Terrimonas ferruginea]|uniref:phytanoyl-CoA dioxygenase family protein n=1 Tax=Terrimonas ferruginea TaxID=249 RepID=UPI000AFA23C2|nr:phytanoyl-CoA dioxygenase family protein [Terrimonas ferruginea]MBN8783765.1 phytanoyl-CoA dioxygenase family protein [Terrimonas ferruginea]